MGLLDFLKKKKEDVAKENTAGWDAITNLCNIVYPNHYVPVVKCISGVK